MENISAHITYKEATKSDTAIRLGIDNEPNEYQLSKMKFLAETIFEPTRRHFGKPIKVSSFFRSEELNSAVGGSSTSQHVKGEAMDIDNDGLSPTNREIFDYIKDNLVFDQLIFEGGTKEDPDWVHVSKKSEGVNRGQVLRMSYKKGKVIYENYVP